MESSVIKHVWLVIAFNDRLIIAVEIGFYICSFASSTLQNTSSSYEEHIGYNWNQETRATPGNLRLLESNDMTRTFTLSLAFIVLIVRYWEGVCRGLFLGTMSVCV
jgi:hypothetical protein